MQKEFLTYIDEHQEDLFKDLAEVISKKSVGAEAVTKNGKYMPFGEDVQNAFEAMLGIADRDGFKTKNVDNYGGHIEFGQGEEILGILGHLDVVPEGIGWETPPYEPDIRNGRMYGRGTSDDKGPVMAAYYAMKALKETGFEPAKRVRIILGLDEETNWEGIEYYLKHEEAPTLGFTPDANFPAIMAEMGIGVFDIAKKFGKNTNKGLELRSVDGGDASNMVASHARAVVRDEIGGYDAIKEAVAAYRQETGYKINCKGVGKSFEITTEGVAAHGAMPEKGLNAISILMEFLGRLSFVNEDAADFVEFYNRYIGFDLHGDKIGCGLEDEISGKLIFNVGVLKMDTESATLTINVRYPVTCNMDQVYDGMQPYCDEYNVGIMKEPGQAPIYKPADDPLVATLMDVYKEHTGDVDSKPLVIGGGTYARATDNIVAYGILFPGDPEVEHMPNEYVPLDKLVLSTKIFADAIYRLTKGEEEMPEEK